MTNPAVTQSGEPPMDVDTEICGRCGCYRMAHGEGGRCEPVGWTFTPIQEEEVKCKRCKGLTVLLVDNGFHYINCPDCHPSYEAIRQQKAAADEAIRQQKAAADDE